MPMHIEMIGMYILQFRYIRRFTILCGIFIAEFDFSDFFGSIMMISSLINSIRMGFLLPTYEKLIQKGSEARNAFKPTQFHLSNMAVYKMDKIFSLWFKICVSTNMIDLNY